MEVPVTGAALQMDEELRANGCVPHDIPVDRDIWEDSECEQCTRPVSWRGYRKGQQLSAFVYCSAGHVQEV